MDAGFEAHLRIDGVSFGRDDAALLRAVKTHQSLNAAASDLGRSFSRAHARIDELEDAIGPLMDRRRGGPDGGGSELTEAALQLLARFDRLQAALSGTARAEEVVMEGTVMSRDGEIAIVATPAGEMRALLFESADQVQIAFRADAVTLHAPGTTPPTTRMSARNRFAGQVSAIDRGEAIAHVRVDVGADESITAVVTRAGLDTLGLAVGDEVVASVKATAARATPSSGATTPATAPY